MYNGKKYSEVLYIRYVDRLMTILLSRTVSCTYTYYATPRLSISAHGFTVCLFTSFYCLQQCRYTLDSDNFWYELKKLFFFYSAKKTLWLLNNRSTRVKKNLTLQIHRTVFLWIFYSYSILFARSDVLWFPWILKIIRKRSTLLRKNLV